MKKKKNIFLTTLGETKNRLDINYYSCGSFSKTPIYTTGVSVAEAGIKFILSQCHIDEIIMIGSPSCVREDMERETSLSDVTIYGVSDIDGMSEYDFLNYRVAEYVMQTDIELIDLAEPISNDRKEELIKRVGAFRRNIGNVTFRELFSKLSTDADFLDSFTDEVLVEADPTERAWVKYYIYNEMDSFYKMHILEDNKNASLKFVPISIDRSLTMEDINNVVKAASADDVHSDMNLYMDIQCLGAIDGNTLISTFLLMNRRIGYGCNVSGLINSYMSPGAFAGRIVNVLENYEIQKIISGMDIFLEYGRVDMLKEYWNSLGISSPGADRIFYGMDCIDEGISMCNVDLIACGINVIRQTLRSGILSENSNIYLDVIIRAIVSDYGPLLKGDELSVAELLKWSLRKGLYQQTLTIIESKVPQDIVKRGIYYYARNDDDISALMKELNFLYWNESSKMRWAFGDIEHYFIKSYGRSYLDFRQKPDMICKDYARLRIDALHGRSEDILPAYSELDNDDLLYELLLGYYRIGNLRNQVNHAVVENVNPDVENLSPRKDSRTELYMELKKFIGIYSRACSKTEKKREPVLLASGRMKSYVSRHKIVPLEENADLTARSTYTCTYNGKEVQINIALFSPEDDIDEKDGE